MASGKPQVTILKILLQQTPLKLFKRQDLLCVAYRLKGDFTFEPEILQGIRNLLTTTKRAKAVFAEVDAYPQLRHTVSSLVLVQINKQIFAFKQRC